MIIASPRCFWQSHPTSGFLVAGNERGPAALNDFKRLGVAKHRSRELRRAEEGAFIIFVSQGSGATDKDLALVFQGFPRKPGGRDVGKKRGTH